MTQTQGIQVVGAPGDGGSGNGGEVLTPDALAFVALLARRFQPRLEQLVARRQQVQARFDSGSKPDFLPETQHIRDSDWQVGYPPPAAI